MKTIPNNCTKIQMKFGTKCSFSCPQRYQLQGPSYQQCGTAGKWTDSAKTVTCVGTFSGTFLSVLGLPDKYSASYRWFSLTWPSVLWDSNDKGHDGHVGAHNKRSSLKFFCRCAPTWPPWRKVKTTDIVFRHYQFWHQTTGRVGLIISRN